MYSVANVLHDLLALLLLISQEITHDLPVALLEDLAPFAGLPLLLLLQMDLLATLCVLYLFFDLSCLVLVLLIDGLESKLVKRVDLLLL